MTGQHGGPLGGPPFEKSVLGRGVHRADHLGLARRLDAHADQLRKPVALVALGVAGEKSHHQGLRRDQLLRTKPDKIKVLVEKWRAS
jgi:hypothetical protein